MTLGHLHLAQIAMHTSNVSLLRVLFEIEAHCDAAAGLLPNPVPARDDQDYVEVLAIVVQSIPKQGSAETTT